MYKKVNITENSLRVLSIFTDGFDREYYVREVAKLLGISPRTAQLTLEGLEKKGLIESKKKGKIKTYRLNPIITRKYLVLIEQYKSLAFLEERLLIKEIIEKITPQIKGIGIIFGSYVKESEKESSDLDILIIGTYNKDEVEKTSENLGIEISVKCYPLNVFKKTLKTDILLREMLKNHVVFLNVEQFVEEVLKDG